MPLPTCLGLPGTYNDRDVKYVTTIERFQLGDYPMVCVRSGTRLLGLGVSDRDIEQSARFSILAKADMRR